MTAAHEPNEIDGPHEGPIKTPKQLILAVFYAFVVPIFGIILLVMYVTTETRPAAGSDAPRAEEHRRADPPGRHGRGQGRHRHRLAEDRRAGLCRAVHRLPRHRRAQCAQARRRRGLGAAHQGRLRRAAALGARRQGPDAGAGRRRLHRLRDRPRRGLHGQPERRQVPGAGGAGRRRLGAGTATTAAAAPATTGARPLRATPAAARRTGAPPPRRPPQTPLPPRPRPLHRRPASVCHAAGVAGAPKIGDKAAWAPRLAQGVDALVASVIKGKGAMPPRGGSTATDAEIKAVVDWMVEPGQVARLPRLEASRPRAGFFCPLWRRPIPGCCIHAAVRSYGQRAAARGSAFAVVPSTTRSAS